MEINSIQRGKQDIINYQWYKLISILTLNLLTVNLNL